MTSVLHTLQLAMQYHQSGRTGEARSLYEQVLHQQAAQPDALHYLGMLLHQVGESEQALAYLERANQISPKNHVFLNNTGTVHLALGMVEPAIASFEKARGAKPSNAEVHANLGKALQEGGRFDDAILSFRKAVQLQANSVAGQIGLGNVLRLAGRPAEAIPHFKKALALQPADAGILMNLGIAYSQCSRRAEAENSFLQAIDNHERAGATLEQLRSQHAKTVNTSAGIENLEDRIAQWPSLASLYSLLGGFYAAEDRIDEATLSYSKSLTIDPKDDVRVSSALMLPAIMDSMDGIIEWRERFDRNLDKLLAEDIRLTNLEALMLPAKFMLAYHGLDNQDLHRKLSRFYLKACPELQFTASHIGSAGGSGHRPAKVGFFSNYVYEHAVAKCFGRVVSELSQKDELQVCLITSEKSKALGMANSLRDFQGEMKYVPDGVIAARTAIAAMELDTLIYLDIGMDPVSFALSFARLAPRQCILAGHPDTTGIPNIDFYISSVAGEPAGAEEHYTEQLVRLPSLTVSYDRPEITANTKGREDFGLPPAGNIYLCPMKLQKLHPEFDFFMGRILELDAKANIVLFHDHQFPSWSEKLARRLDKAVHQDLRSRILFLPWIREFSDFIAIHAISSVVIDPIHFGIGSTAIATFSVGTPVVTLPGEFLRGRVGLMYNELLETPECVAVDSEDYARKAVAIANDEALRESVKARILKNNYRLFESSGAADSFATFLRGLP